MRIVVIAEEKEVNPKNDFYATSFDFSSKTVTQNIIRCLKNKNYDVVHYLNPQQFLDNIKKHKNDIVFSTLWGGPHSRNKRSYLSSICEAYQIKYIGADTYVQALCQDKYLSKLYLENYMFKIPKYIEIKTFDELKRIDYIDFFPCIIKPSNEGSSVGISDNNIANNKEEAITLAKKILKKYRPILVEQFIDGREISICLAGTTKNIRLCEAVELLLNDEIVGSKIWGFESKKNKKSKVTRKIITNEFPNQFINEAKKIFLELGKVDLMRIDGKWENNNFYVIELSSDCSLHKECFMSSAFKYNNYTYDDMLDVLIQIYLDNYNENK